MAQKVRFVPRSPELPFTNVTLIFSFKGRRVVMATGITVPSKHWDSKNRRVKNTRDYPLHIKINSRLNDIEKTVLDVWYNYQKAGLLPSVETFKEELTKRLFTVEQEAPELLPFLQQVIDERRAMKKNTAAHTNLAYHLKAYKEARKKAVTFAGLTKEFTNDFTIYLFSRQTNEGLSLTDTYVNKLLVTLRSVARQANDRGIYANAPILGVKLEVKVKKADNIYLNESELLRLFRLELEHGSRLGKVRDAFLIGAYTGLRFSDYIHVRPESFQDVQHGDKVVKCLVVTTQKTKTKVTLPISHPELIAVLERNNWSSPKWGNRGEDAISNQKLNQYLKELGKLAGLVQAIEINEYRAGGHEKKAVQKWELISSHTARRSFATNAFKAGVPIKNIIEFTGHSTVEQFMDYIKTTAEESAVMLSDHPFFTGKTTLKVV